MASYGVYLSPSKLIYFSLVIQFIIAVILEKKLSTTKAELISHKGHSEGKRAIKYNNATKHLQTIFTGRCYDHCKDTKNDCAEHLNCDDLWNAFKNAFVTEDPCSISAHNYDDFINQANITVPENKALFWSRTKETAYQFATVGGYVTLEHTLIGLLGDGLTWCGKKDSAEVADMCPDFQACESATSAFWNKTSETFARKASGEVQVLLNGSSGLAFNKSSIFGSIEVPNLDSKKVSHMNIWILYYFNGSSWVKKECCNSSSVINLMDTLMSKNINYSCTENNSRLIPLHCARFSDESTYKLCVSGMSSLTMTFSTAASLLILTVVHKCWEELVLHC